MTDQVTISNPPQHAVCKSVCWLIGIAAGSYLAIALVNDFGVVQGRAAVLGIVTTLLSGLLMRRLFCRQRGSRVQIRVKEAAARKAASETTAKPSATGRVPDKSAPRKAVETPKKPDGQQADASLKKRLMAEADAIARTPAPVSTPVSAPVSSEKPQNEKPAPVQSAPPLVLEAEAKVAPPTPAAQPEQIKGAPPKPLEAPENGTPDALQEIDGIGEAEEKALHAAGVFHYSQFVAMNKRNLVWLDENIATGGGQGQPSVAWRKQAIALSRKAQ